MLACKLFVVGNLSLMLINCIAAGQLRRRRFLILACGHATLAAYTLAALQ